MNPYMSTGRGWPTATGRASSISSCSTRGARDVLADEVGRAALRCIRCSACLNVCPVYERTGGHAYEKASIRDRSARSSRLSCRVSRTRRRCRGPSSLCGACYEVCPVKIDIPTILVHLRGRVVREVGAPAPERAAMAAMARVFAAAAPTRPPSARPSSGVARWPVRRYGRGRARASCPRCPSRPSGTGGAMGAREDILARVRAALRDVPAGEAIEPPAYEPPPAPSGNAVARFAERVSDYRATVREADALAETIAQCLRRARGPPAGRAAQECWRGGGRKGSSSSRTRA